METNVGETELTYSYTEANRVWAEYRNDGRIWSAREELLSSPVTKNWILKQETGNRTVFTKLTDIAGNVSSEYSDLINHSYSLINNFKINNGNIYSCSPVLRVSSNTAESGVQMNLHGDSYTGWIDYSSVYDISSSDGIVEGEFKDTEGFITDCSDTITISSSPEDTKYENQSIPSHLASSAYDLGSFYNCAFAIHLDDYSGDASLWDEDWYKIHIINCFSHSYHLIRLNSTTELYDVTVEVYYDEEKILPSPIGNYFYFSDVKSLDLYMDSNKFDFPETFYIKVYQLSAEYTGNIYNMYIDFSF